MLNTEVTPKKAWSKYQKYHVVSSNTNHNLYIAKDVSVFGKLIIYVYSVRLSFEMTNLRISSVTI